jgi:chromosome segregation ATPase
MTNRLNLLGLSKMSWAAFILLMTAMVMPVAAQPLTPAEIDALQRQLVEARNVAAALDARVQCYVDRDNSFHQRSKQLQLNAAGLHQQEDELSARLQQEKYKAESFERDYVSARNDMHNLKRKMDAIQHHIRRLKAELDDCKSKAWIFGFVCDFAGEISGLNSHLRNLAADSRVALIKMQSLEKNLRDAERRKNQAQQELQKTQSQLNQTTRDLAATEAEIKSLKASLARIREVKQDYSSELNQFEYAFNEFENLDPASDRRFVVRRLRHESEDLKGLLAQARGLLDENGLLLPTGKRICAN